MWLISIFSACAGAVQPSASASSTVASSRRLMFWSSSRKEGAPPHAPPDRVVFRLSGGGFLGFFQQRIEETVMPRVGQQLSILEPGQRRPASVPGAREEGINGLCVFLREHRARRIQQFTTRGQQLPQRIEHPSLGGG